MNVQLGRGPFWTQGVLLMGPKLLGCRVVLGQCAIFCFRSTLGFLELFSNRQLPESDEHRGGAIEQRRMTAFRLFVRYSQMISWGISERIRGKPRNFRFLMQSICRLAEVMP